MNSGKDGPTIAIFMTFGTYKWYNPHSHPLSINVQTHRIICELPYVINLNIGENFATHGENYLKSAGQSCKSPVFRLGFLTHFWCFFPAKAKWDYCDVM